MTTPDSRDGSARDAEGAPTEASPSMLDPRRFAYLNAVVSSAAICFLIWLIYFHEAASEGGEEVVASAALPAWNAVFNATSATFLLAGLRAIRRGERARHRQWMLAALTSSALFLVNYVYYHAIQGDTLFAGQGWVRPVYFALLISHVLLSIVVLPMILTSVYLGLSDRIAAHKRLSRWTFGGWMYVSVTGVLIFFMLHVIDWS